eukprot:TRINITY_DN56800_c0_g1_i1.p1 TRINITY_DN56800_c0_g1~~TRINITY_DN56800_c0_g1_i1.p1  ORF type:complete len:290 (-),score=42.12 TRINITY_DN56800_c0_g1_i1:75-944(-)
MVKVKRKVGDKIATVTGASGSSSAIAPVYRKKAKVKIKRRKVGADHVSSAPASLATSVTRIANASVGRVVTTDVTVAGPSVVEPAVAPAPKKRRKKAKPRTTRVVPPSSSNRPPDATDRKPATDAQGPSMREDRSTGKHLVAALVFRRHSTVEAFLHRELSKHTVGSAAMAASAAPSDDIVWPKEALGAALAHCAGRGLLSCVRLLLSHGAPVEGGVGIGGRRSASALVAAASCGYIDICKELLSHGASDRSAARKKVVELAQLNGNRDPAFAKDCAVLMSLLDEKPLK